MFNEQVFWTMAPDQDEDCFDLNISNLEAPKFLTICNDPEIASALSPAISCIISIVMSKINVRGKNKTLFAVDEIPTIFIKDLDNLPATGRANQVVTMLAAQDRAQLIRDYGQKQFDALMGSLGTQAVGMTNNPSTAKAVSDMMGTIKKSQISITQSSGNYSENESLRDEKALQPRDISGQEMGQFTGKIADGRPPFFRCQMPYFDHSNPKIYPNYYGEVIMPSKDDWKTGELAEDKDTIEGLLKMNFERIVSEVEDIMQDSIQKVDMDRQANKK